MVGEKDMYGRVAVLAGGRSDEREISLQGGVAVLNALKRSGISAEMIDARDDIFRVNKFDRVFIMVHGLGGEDGSLQGFLETLEIPYTGSRVTASALCMDKYLTKLLWNEKGIPTPKFNVVPSDDVDGVGDFPVVVKPSTQGSSIGMSLVSKKEEMVAAIAHAKKFDSTVLVERYIEGDELTVSIVREEVLPVVKIATPSTFYDYDAKYLSEKTQYLLPNYSVEEIEAIKQAALTAYNVLGVEGWGRVDLIRDKKGNLWFLEVNTVPGMTSHSLVPKAAEKVDMSYEELVINILNTSIGR